MKKFACSFIPENYFHWSSLFAIPLFKFQEQLTFKLKFNDIVVFTYSWNNFLHVTHFCLSVNEKKKMEQGVWIEQTFFYQKIIWMTPAGTPDQRKSWMCWTLFVYTNNPVEETPSKICKTLVKHLLIWTNAEHTKKI